MTGSTGLFEDLFATGGIASGFERALIVTLDGYGTGLAGSVSLGEGGRIQRLHNIRFPHSLGSFYEMVTSSLGFSPDRHAGKIVGLAAYGDPDVLSPVLLSRIEQRPGDYRLLDNLNVYFSRYLATRYPKVDLAAAWQHVLEVVAVNLVKHWLAKTGCKHLVLSGNKDDGFDTAQGFVGNVQFLVVQQIEPDDTGMEWDNTDPTSDATPRNIPNVYNATIIGSGEAAGTTGLVLRRGTGSA